MPSKYEKDFLKLREEISNVLNKDDGALENYFKPGEYVDGRYFLDSLMPILEEKFIVISIDLMNK